ncbi:MAG TPA: 5-dehydro-4-deoxy-D-glucuronate isomerase [Lacibacter sp.]|nr:5-dehydro-4-deoxy-D-glucuronate isomerase [Lacibacter sp.]HMO89195.1 5-dehydro-4-deoxy-D-glucuronate isomerase [Lacibacter sp.]HMP86145.1 5-dehydro-4-deoxy-D-glucuronate isomerase [Lacibacter sp.]
MEIRFQESPQETRTLDTTALRSRFLVQQLFQKDQVQLVYTHYDRVIIGGVQPEQTEVALPTPGELKAANFLERREMGVINVGGVGTIYADGSAYTLDKLDCLYLGKGVQEVRFISADAAAPAQFYLLSAPAHQAYPTRFMNKGDAAPVQLGHSSTSNERTIYKYIHAGGIQSCQLVMGLTALQPGSVWNSVPPHTHTRRMEVYFYFDVPADQRVFHMMGQPQETRHLVMANHEAVISPPWSMHFGCGTSNYGFIWGMAGENQEFTDMDPAPIPELK